MAIADELARAAQASDVPLTLGLARRLLDDVPAKPPRSTTPAAITPVAPVVADIDTFFLDREKTIWEWPELGGRAIEELR